VVKLITVFDKDTHIGCNKIFFTGSIDHFITTIYNYYRSINFIKEYLDMDYYQDNSVVNHPQHETNNEIHLRLKL
jgi:UDP-galactopyranose mutase